MNPTRTRSFAPITRFALRAVAVATPAVLAKSLRFMLAPGRPAEPRRAAMEFVQRDARSNRRCVAVPLGSRHLLSTHFGSGVGTGRSRRISLRKSPRLFRQ